MAQELLSIVSNKLGSLYATDYMRMYLRAVNKDVAIIDVVSIEFDIDGTKETIVTKIIANPEIITFANQLTDNELAEVIQWK